MLLKILQNSQENTYVESFFNKIARVLSDDPLWNFQEHLFSNHASKSVNAFA